MPMRLGIDQAWRTAYVIVSSQQGSFGGANLKSLDHPFLVWKTAATGAQSAIYDFGTAVAINGYHLANSTCRQFSVQSDDVITFGSGSLWTSGAITIAANRHWNGRYNYSLLRIGAPARRYHRLTLPSQTPTDGESYYSIGAFVPRVLETVPRGLKVWQPFGRLDPFIINRPEGHEAWGEKVALDEPVTVLRCQPFPHTQIPVATDDELRDWMDLQHRWSLVNVATVALEDEDPTKVWAMQWENALTEWDGVYPASVATLDLKEVIGGSTNEYANDDPGENDMTGTARLQRDSATQISLQRGQIPLKASGVWGRRTISTPPTVSNATLAANTTYYCYAFDNLGPTLIALVAVGHVTDTDTGVEVLSGDPSRTYVGMVRTNASAQFVDTAAQRFVASHFNRKRTSGSAGLTANRTTTSSAFVEIHAEIRVEFLAHADEDIRVGFTSWADHTVVNGPYQGGVGIDGAAPAGNEYASANVPTAAGQRHWQGLTVSRRLAEGYHYATLMVSTASGTIQYQASGTKVFVEVNG